MYSHKMIPAIVLTALIAMQAAAVAEDSKIGSAVTAKDKVEGIVGGKSEEISTGTSVFRNETIRTGETGVANLGFIDRTKLTVGPTSEVRLDKFVYDPSGSSSSVVLAVTKGAFRFVTGSQDKRAYKVDTPFGSLGVRGTIVELVITLCTPGLPHSECGASLKLVECCATFTTLNGQIVDLSRTDIVVHVDGDGHVTEIIETRSILKFAMTGPPGPAGPPPPPPYGPPPPPGLGSEQTFALCADPASSWLCGPGPWAVGTAAAGVGVGIVIYESTKSKSQPASP